MEEKNAGFIPNAAFDSFLDAQHELAFESGTEPSITEIAEKTGLSMEQSTRIYASVYGPAPSYEDISKEFNRVNPDPDEMDRYVKSCVEKGEFEKLGKALKCLKERECLVLVRHYGLPDGIGLQAGDRILASLDGLSDQRIQQIEQKALSRLHLAIKAIDCEESFV